MSKKKKISMVQMAISIVCHTIGVDGKILLTDESWLNDNH